MSISVLTPDQQALTRILQDLGYSSKEVAQTLENKGVKGRRKSTLCCPIAQFLKGEGFHFASVNHRRCGVAAEKGPPTCVDMPTAAADFVFHFDRGKYPQLDEQLEREEAGEASTKSGR